MAVLRILGIDPGTQVVGYACLEAVVREVCSLAATEAPMVQRASNLVVRRGGHGPATLLAAGSLELGGRKVSLPARLHRLAGALDELIERFAPAELALEEAFFGKSVQAALRIGEARGVVLAVARGHGLSIHQYPPAKIKRAVTGRGSATKEAVAAMAGQLLSSAP